MGVKDDIVKTSQRRLYATKDHVRAREEVGVRGGWRGQNYLSKKEIRDLVSFLSTLETE